MMVPGYFLRAVEVGAWLVAVAWVYRVVEAAVGLPEIADLLEARYDVAAEGSPSLVVIVPARDEAANIGACLGSLIEQDCANLRVIAVNDRSSDGTGAVMDEVAAAHPGRLQVLHVTALPEGWLGKTHAMSLAAELAGEADWLLFTDADVVFRVDALRRSVAYAEKVGADHLVTMPTTIIRRWDEATLLGFLQVFGLWAARPWKVADPKAKRDALGVGAFNLIRRGVYEQVGGVRALRMAVIEDLGLARRVKRAGFAQRIAFGRGLVNVHWASGSMGLVRVMTKNMFSAFNFHVALALGACGWLAVFCVAPAVGFFVAGLRLPAVVVLLALMATYRMYGKVSGIPAWQALLFPFAAVLLLYAVARSVVVTLWQGGIVWRGTFYRLDELRRNAPPLL